MDIFYWPVMDLVLWGFLSYYIEKLNLGNVNFVTIFLGSIILWSIFHQAQQSISVAFLEEVWEKNLLNIFVTPLTIMEFLFSTLFLGVVKIFLVTIVLAVLAYIMYAFNFFVLGFTLIPFLINLLVFGWVLGLFTMAVIMRFGTSAQVLAFGFIFILQPFCAVFYPVSALPHTIQFVSYLIPSTYVFEGMREVLATGILPMQSVVLGAVWNLFYLALVMFLFYGMFNWMKRQGRILKLD
jgi:ABC-2 type transport system permease protein